MRRYGICITYYVNIIQSLINLVVSDKSSLDPNCFPIGIPADDPFWKGKRRCMEFTRSMNIPNQLCPLEPRQQVSYFFGEFSVYCFSISQYVR